MSTPRRAVVLTLDPEPEAGQRRLDETVKAAGFRSKAVASLNELVEHLDSTPAQIAVLAFEALWPEPQRSLRRIREAAPACRILVAFAEGTPRFRLVQRLWAAGFMDYLVSRDATPKDLGRTLRQAQAEAAIASATGETGSSENPEAARLYARMRFLQNLSAALTNQTRIDSLLRDLQSKLPNLLDFHALQVMVCGESRPALHVYQTVALEHDVLWGLAQASCDAVTPFLEAPLAPDQLTFVEGTPTAPLDAERSVRELSPQNVIALPLVHGGELVGCLTLLLAYPDSITAEHRVALQLVSYQVAAALKNALIVQAAEDASLIDELTGAHNRRYMRRVLESEWTRSRRYNEPFTVVMLDLDHFKRVNDLHGHVVGDAVLRAIASLMREHLRSTDHVVRYGGEEFLMLLPETGANEAALVMERVRLLLAHQPVYSSDKTGPVQVSFSAGVASTPGCTAKAPDELIRLADEALYAAKSSGRDRICLASAESFKGLESVSHASDKRKFARIPSQVRVRYMELPEFASQSVSLRSLDISAGGAAVHGPKEHLKKNAYALVYLEDDQKPLLSQVVWTKETNEGQRSAGLRFLRPPDLHAGVEPQAPAVRPKAAVWVQRQGLLRLVERALTAAQYEIHVFDGKESPAVDVDLSGYAMVVVGEASVRRALGEQLAKLRPAKGVLPRVVVLNEGVDRQEAIRDISTSEVEHWVSDDEISAEETLFATLTKLLLGEYFGIKKYLQWGALTRSWTIERVEEKERVLHGIASFAEEVHCHPRVSDLLIAAVDEMIINSFFAARESKENLAAPVFVECGSDGRLLAVAVLDEHGAFRQRDLFGALGDALKRESEGVVPEGGSARMGFRIMLSGLSQLAINVEPGRCTEIIGIVDLRKSLRELRATAPSVGIFAKDEPKLEQQS